MKKKNWFLRGDNDTAVNPDWVMEGSPEEGDGETWRMGSSISEGTGRSLQAEQTEPARMSAGEEEVRESRKGSRSFRTSLQCINAC